MTIPDEIVERAWKAGQADWYGRWDKSTLRVAMESVNPVFLTDEERQDVLSAIARQHEYFDEIGVKHTFLTVLEKLS